MAGGFAPRRRIEDISTAEGTILQIGTVAIDGRSRAGEILLSRTAIGKGSNGTTVFEGTYDGEAVAVKRLVRGHRAVDFDEIYHLMTSSSHPNIVRYRGAKYDLDFVDLAMERCRCSLHDLIVALSASSDLSVFPHDPPSMAKYKNKLESIRVEMQDVNLWIDGGHPSVLLLKLMRDVVLGLNHLHKLGIIHGDLKPQNILITGKPLVAKLSDMGISKWVPEDELFLGYHAASCGTSGWRAPELLLNGHQTPSVDAFNLGCVLFFCLTRGRHPFGGIERDINVMTNKMDLSLVESIPHARDLISSLLNPNPELRPKASDVLDHPVFQMQENLKHADLFVKGFSWELSSLW